MDVDRARRAHAVLTEAIGRPRDEREALVAAACAGDAELERHVRRLLAAADRSAGFLETPALSRQPSPAAPVPDAVGSYLVVGVLGSGGMATVYEAIQENPRRRVALKVMHHHLTDAEAVSRFRFESEALARLRHPGIAQIHEAGAARLGQPTASPFFAMELVPDALPITEYARRHALPLRARLGLFAAVCDAVLHGHQNGIIHRDIKPDNVLVGPDGQPKVIDFGIARVVDASAAPITRDAGAPRLVGTLSAMSPEQCASSHDVDVRTDVYSLGVLLYELVAGRRPYDLSGRSIPDAVRVIREHTPPPPSDHEPAAAGDLDAIVAKAMDKDPARRYAGAGAIADDVRRHLDSRPIEARPATALDHLGKFARRNRALAAAVAAAALALVAGVVVSSRLAYVAGQARDEALRRQRELEAVTGFQESILRGIDIEAMGDGLRRSVTTALAKSARAGAPPAPDAAALTEGVNFTSIAIGSLNDAVLARYRRSIDERFADQPALRARLLIQLADTMRSLGLHADAEPVVRHALAIRREALGPDHEDTIIAAHALASLLSTLGGYDEAMALLDDARARLARNPARDPRLALRVDVNAGGVHRRLGNHTEAERIWTRALAEQRRLLGDDHPDTVRTLSNLSIVLADLGRVAEAEAAMRGVVDSRRRVSGEDSPEYRASLGNLGVLLLDQGRYAEARPLIERSLEAHRRRYGDRHEYTLVTIAQLADLLQEMGDLAPAEALQRECVEGRRAALSAEHRDTLRVQAQLASTIRRRGRAAEAEALITETLAAQRRTVGEGHGDVIISMAIAAEIALAVGKTDDALALMRDVIDRARKGSAPPAGLGRVLAVHAAVLHGAGKLEDAMARARESYDLLAQSRGPTHPWTRAVAARAADLSVALAPKEPAADHDAQTALWRERAALATPAATAGRP